MSAILKHDQFWQLNYQKLLFYNNVELATTINKLIKECMSTSTKDALADLTLQELLIRIIQTQTAKAINDGAFQTQILQLLKCWNTLEILEKI
jgi:hypothetical protein